VSREARWHLYAYTRPWQEFTRIQRRYRAHAGLFTRFHCEPSRERHPESRQNPQPSAVFGTALAALNRLPSHPSRAVVGRPSSFVNNGWS